MYLPLEAADTFFFKKKKDWGKSVSTFTKILSSRGEGNSQKNLTNEHKHLKIAKCCKEKRHLAIISTQFWLINVVKMKKEHNSSAKTEKLRDKKESLRVCASRKE